MSPDLSFLRRRTRPSPVAHHKPTRPVVRVRSGTRTLLGPATPMVTLNRLQSGVGALVVEALCSAAVGDLRLGCAYTLTDGQSSLVRGSTPVLSLTRREFDRLTVDLRQNRKLRRLIVYGYSESGRSLRWGGTLAVTTLGGARLDLPVDGPPSAGVTVFLALYNVDGEIVLRSEMSHVDGDVRDACQAYGFDRITWLDGRTPTH